MIGKPIRQRAADSIRGLKSNRGGFAMLAVLLVLMALFVLATPYLLGIRRADRESERLFDRTAARLALDDAARHARARLDATHPALDTTPYWDSEEELAVDNELDEDFLDADDPSGVMWDLEVSDLAGLIDLSSASPGVIANLIGQNTWLSEGVAKDAQSLVTASTRGFPLEGFLWVGGERMAFLQHGDASFEKLERGLFPAAKAARGREVNPLCDESAERAHAAGAPVLGLAALALAEWRIAGANGELRLPADMDQLERAFEQSLSGPLDGLSLAELGIGATIFGAANAGRRWQRAVRLVDAVVGGTDCVLRVDDANYFNPGTTVLITNGRHSELALVRSVGPRTILLQSVLQHDFGAHEAVVRPLARRPVNLNTAPEEVLHALFLGLKLVRKNARITDLEADCLTEVVLGSRPFKGFEDFLERIVLPAAGLAKRKTGAGGNSDLWKRVGADGFLDPEDAEALYKNGLNANDAGLEFSTMPFAFTSRGAFELSLRSSINAKSGVERASSGRRQVEVVVPQRELMRLWARQEDFDEELRLSREAPFWSTGPEATSRSAGGTTPPSRFAAHVGSLAEGELEGEFASSFASREDNGWAQLFAIRSDDRQTPYHTRHVEHMDRESSDLEGKSLSHAGAHVAETFDKRVEWSAGQGELLRPFSFSMWMKPRRRSVGQLYFDLGDSQYFDSDRISIAEDSDALVLQLLDAGGDHRATALIERGEVRVPIEHFPLDTWTHLSIDVRGNRPDQMTVLVDGMARGETAGLTRLTGALAETATAINVESTVGFGAVGERCVLRIGDETIGAEVTGPTSLLAAPGTVGVNAGIGGRAAREREVWTTDGSVLLSEGALRDRDHPIFSAVELMGYSRPLRSPAPTGSAPLQVPIGPFAVAVVTAVAGGDAPRGDVIRLSSNQGDVDIGFGLEGQSSSANGLILGRADDPDGTDTSFLTAFNPRGGYAMLVQERIPISVDGGPAISVTSKGTPLGGFELIRYSGLIGNRLVLSGRGTVVLSELRNVSAGIASSSGYAAFITNYDAMLDPDLNEQLGAQLFVVPISLPANNVFPGQQKFLEPQLGITEYAQLTRLGADRHLTEWIAYDEISLPRGGMPQQFVRDDPKVIERVYQVLTPGVFSVSITTTPPGGTGGVPLPGNGAGLPPAPGGESGGGVGLDPIIGAAKPVPVSAAALFAAPAPLQDGALSAFDDFGYWSGDLGTAEDDNYPLSRSARTVLGFRGVMGTYSHAHPAGTSILPVFRVWHRDGEVGLPGGGDRAWLLDQNIGSIGEEVTVHRAYLPDERYRIYTWQSAGLLASPGSTATVLFEEFVASAAFHAQIFIALQDPVRVFLPPTMNPNSSSSQPVSPLLAREMRRVARLSKFPSGELPRVVESISVGGDFRGPSGGRLPDAIVDELEFGATRYGQNLAPGEAGRGAAMLLAQSVGAGPVTLEIVAGILRDTRGLLNTTISPLSDLPETGGLLRIGEEIVAYASVDPQGTSIVLTADGRGMLGTEEQPHRVGETLMYLSQLRSSTLIGALGAAEADLSLASLRGLPTSGTLLVGGELLHFTRSDGGNGPGVVGMPRASVEPGARDGRGGALFRGRYGTAATTHAADAPVVLFPTRYWDRWADAAEAPELAYFGFVAGQESAYWKTAFFDERESQHPGPALGVMIRSASSSSTSSTVAWDDDPDHTAGLWRFDRANEEDTRLPLGVQSDRLEWRVFVRYEPGSFNYDTGLAHGWKTTPQLRFTGVEFVAPRTTLYREQR